MVSFPNCKINLGLSVIDKRKDGYHNLETVFYPLAVNDALEIISMEDPADAVLKNDARLVEFSSSGLPVNVHAKDNLCTKAYFVLQEDYPALPPVQMHLLKAIPIGAGLGGGSADGAFVLSVLNDLFRLELSTRELIHYALKLGSDCPFFIINKPCFASGRGEIMEPLLLDLSEYSIVLVYCGISINTGWAFNEIDEQNHAIYSEGFENVRDIVMLPVSSWRGRLLNDFERPVFEKFPALQAIKEKLYANGALYAAMSGSGSTVFGIFKKNSIPKLDFPPEYRMFEV